MEEPEAFYISTTMTHGFWKRQFIGLAIEHSECKRPTLATEINFDAEIGGMTHNAEQLCEEAAFGILQFHYCSIVE